MAIRPHRKGNWPHVEANGNSPIKKEYIIEL